MDPRFIIKTHTEALRPRNYSILITKCTYPDRSAYPEAIMRRLQDWIREKSVAQFTVLLSTKKNRGFGFLLDNMLWSWKGHVINTVLSYIGKKESEELKTFDELTYIEKVCYTRYFLETEGAIILKLAERCQKMGFLTYSYLKDSIQEIFKEIYEEYMNIASDFRSRIKIKEMYGLAKTNEHYDKSTLPHKIKPHLQALEDLGILFIERKHGEEIYKPVNFDKSLSTDIILRKLKDIENMERLFSNYEYFALITEIYNLKPAPFSCELHEKILKESLTYGYQVMRDKVTGMADIDSLIDWCCIKMLVENNVLVGKQNVEDLLNKIRKEQPSKILYHVDGKGRIAYLILSESL